MSHRGNRTDTQDEGNDSSMSVGDWAVLAGGTVAAAVPRRIGSNVLKKRQWNLIRPAMTASYTGAAALFSWLTSKEPSASPQQIGEHSASPQVSHDRNIRIVRPLGEGGFGKVLEGRLGTARVAVKVLNSGALNMTAEQFLQEAEVMRGLKHPNIVKCYGTEYPINGLQRLCIVMEYMPKGSLDGYLQIGEGRNLPVKSLVKSLLKISLNAAQGMKYLEDKKVLHRDLAARNVLMGENLVAKIADFGLSRTLQLDSIYQSRPGRPFPIFWTSPEGIEFRQYSHQSDVWSYGVLLYEIFSNASVPKPAGVNSSQELLQWLKAGNRLQPPAKCPREVYVTMQKCWALDRNQRPKFAEIEWELTRELNLIA